MDIWQPVIVALVGLLVAVVTQLTRWVNQKITEAKSKLTAEQFALVDGLSRVAVTAANQFSAGAAGGPFTGEEKLKFAADALTSSASRLGVTLKPEEVLAFIHSVLADVKAAA